jgi:hypothetical protein
VVVLAKRGLGGGAIGSGRGVRGTGGTLATGDGWSSEGAPDLEREYC